MAGKALDRALRDYDRDLSLVWINEAPELPPGAIGGRWHVRRLNPAPLAPTFIPITHPDGSYREPDFGILRELQERDMWKEGAVKRHLTHDVDAKALKYQKDLRDEQALDEMKSDFRAAKRVAGEGGLRSRKWRKGLTG